MNYFNDINIIELYFSFMEEKLKFYHRFISYFNFEKFDSIIIYKILILYYLLIKYFK